MAVYLLTVHEIKTNSGNAHYNDDIKKCHCYSNVWLFSVIFGWLLPTVLLFYTEFDESWFTQRQFNKDWERSSRYRHGPTQFLPDQLTKLTTEGAKSSWLLPHKHQCSQSFHVSANFRRFLAFLINFCTDSAA